MAYDWCPSWILKKLSFYEQYSPSSLILEFANSFKPSLNQLRYELLKYLNTIRNYIKYNIE